jgi:hypothetical protein
VLLDEFWKSQSDLAHCTSENGRRELDERIHERVPWKVVKSLIQGEALDICRGQPRSRRCSSLVLLFQNSPALWKHLLTLHLCFNHQHRRLLLLYCRDLCGRVEISEPRLQKMVQWLMRITRLRLHHHAPGMVPQNAHSEVAQVA